METSTSVYMCFPCYEEFDTLEEVLKHQLTCTAEVTDAPPVTSITAPLTVSLLQDQKQATTSRATVTPQNHVQAGGSRMIAPAPAPAATHATASTASSDQPRILYQCGDCNELFKTLVLWQQHRKEGSCRLPVSGTESKLEPGPDPEPDPVQNNEQDAGPDPEPDQGPDPEPDPDPGESRWSEDAPVDAQDQTTLPKAGTEKQLQSPVSELTSNPEDSSPSKRRGANKKPKPEPVLLCVDCGSSFGLVSELVAHRRSQHGLEEALHRCSVCGESFLNTTLFLYHRKQHRQKGEEKHLELVVVEEMVEGVCSQSSGAGEQGQDATPSATTSTSSFTQPESFMCTQCGDSFNNEVGLANHRKEKHGLQEALHHCSQCGQDFMNTTQYLYHRRVHRSNPVTEVEDGTETSVEIATTTPQDTSQTSKRQLSPPASSSESGLPQPKRGRPSLMAVARKNDKEPVIKEELESSLVTDNLPPPAKLLQDWARTPLPHVCPYCGKTFTRRVFLRAHVYSHTGEKLFTCKVCTKSFTNSQSLLRHTVSHTNTKPFNCDVCGKNFSQAATLKRHKLIHSSTLPRRKRGRKPVPMRVCTLDNEGAAHLFPCPTCPSRFNTEEQLNHHKLLHTSHPFPCKLCGEAFKRRKELDLHSLSHQDKQPATCPNCTAQFINQSVLDIHMQRCTTNEEERNVGRGRGQGRGRCTGQIECDLCGHCCMTQEGLDLHRLSHTGQTPLKCPVSPCRRRFASNGALEEHVVAHFQGAQGKAKNRPRFRCQVCHKDFAYTSTFKVHMRTHTDERPFECTTCGKRFRQLPHLQDHERIHSGLRPFCCWVCGKSFSVAARLTEHARTHSGEKPYPCPHCPSAFRSRSNLDKHIRLHGDLPEANVLSQSAEAAHIQKVLEGAKVLSSLANVGEGEPGTVQTIFVLQGADGGTETVMIGSDQLAAMDGASQVVILPSGMLGSAQAITVPTISLEGSEITIQEQSPSIEFVMEETI